MNERKAKIIVTVFVLIYLFGLAAISMILGG